VAAIAIAVVALTLAQGGYGAQLSAALTIFVWWLVFAAIWLSRPEGGLPPWMSLAAGGCLAGIAALSAISTGWASDDGRAMFDAVRALGYTGLFALVVIATRRWEGRRWLQGIALGFGAVAVIALATRFIPGLPGGDEQLAGLIPSARGRLSYPIGYWNGLAACMAIGVVLLTWWGATSPRRELRAAAIALIPLCSLVVYLASSRGGVVAGMVGLAALLAFSPRRARILAGLLPAGIGSGVLVLIASRQHELLDGLNNSTATDQGTKMVFACIVVCALVAALRSALDGPIEGLQVPRRVAQWFAAGVAVCALIGLIAINPAHRLDEFNDPPSSSGSTSAGIVASHLSSGNGSGRYQFWDTAVHAFQDEPLRGVGAGGFGLYWNQHGTIAQTVRDAHSLFLESLAELGILGFALIAGFLGLGLFNGVMRALGRGGGSRELAAAALALLATGITSAAIDWTWEIPVVFAPVIIAVALLTGRGTLVAYTPDGGYPSSRTSSEFGWGVATLIAGWIAICIAALVFLGQLELERSQSAVANGRLADAAREASDAGSLEPWSAAPPLQLGLVEELGGDLTAARKELERAAEKSPQDWTTYVLLARVETKQGDLTAARASLARARKLNPNALSFPPPPAQ
jgi:hypothetical protein